MLGLKGQMLNKQQAFRDKLPCRARCRALRVVASAHDIAKTESAPRRVVVTGMGVVSCLGHEHGEFYNNLLAGKSGISLIEGFNASDYTTRFAGEIKSLDCSGYVTKKFEKRVDPVIKYILVAGKKALGDAGLAWDGQEIKDLNRLRCGTLVGTAMGGMTSFANAVEALETSGHRKMNPFCIPFAINNMGGAMLAMDLGFMGPNYSISTACATGNYCILSAADHIKRGDADLMLAGAGDAAIIPSGIGGFIACKALSKRNDDPASASRPWDTSRDGFVMGEGAAVLVLEEYEHAKARGAHIYAEYVGGAVTCDAHHMTEPQPEGKGVIMCLERALASAGLTAADVNYVNAHATSTQAGDMAEYRAINSVFGHSDLRMNSTKSMIGHLLGGAGAVEAVATIKAIETGWLHPTINLHSPEEGVDPVRVVAGTKQHHPVRVALSNSFGFGGHNSAVLFRGPPQ
ncbi:Protein TRANSPORT INHIBITOR RESPONSE 1 [Pleodorina starrii]|uniref:3-oxoacyl-[acyl-carrier-protein] synthase n=1 Tax=Pleodorina starrii TaxID=330485 RepID=A0A9W6BVF5_9CHLO|nr:Protein TRANSPORT INHIBITOR RESPONSE 1 [Pleodorina starrii]GLC58928.1 Protein TRANSPORT INHIBITOR RESPONSE 1 [Pleodorina starrii]GLC65089.1 Protein TRANSPORT INHIBITOR RESPONSE 1 [Pleodorina starrii]